MRDINRIDPILDELNKYWKTNQDLRFGQLIYLIQSKFDEIGKNLFFSEDDIWLEFFKDLNEKEENK